MWRSIHVLRWLCLIEGISLLVLVGIAMPLKYFADQPLAVRYVGLAHGLLWIALCLNLAGVAWSHRWAWVRVLSIFLSSLIPLGFVIADPHMRRWANEQTTTSK